MKKVVILLLIILRLASVAQSQNYEVLYVDNSGHFTTHWFCYNDDTFDGIIIYGETSCDNVWYVTMWDGNENTVIIDEQGIDHVVINNQHTYPLGFAEYYVNYNGCDIVEFNDFIGFQGTTTGTNPFAESIVWKRGNESAVLDANPNHMSWDCLWSTGEADETIEVIEPGIYSVTITDDCGSATYSIEVRDNVEIYRATTDLVINKNQVTWKTTPEQSEYITSVKVYRNNELVGTVPYADGVFTDNMGSENTQWQYHIVGVSVEGDDCPIPSYWKRTIHLDRIQDSQGNLILQWTPYEGESPENDVVAAYGIYDVVNGVPNHVIDVGNFTNVYTYNPADFHGYGAVAAVFEEKGLEEFAFSNLTKQMLAIDENITESPVMKVYPNPSNGTFTVECVSDLIVYDVIGQIITTSHSANGMHTFTLPSGIYFLKSEEGTVRKVLVE